MIFFLVVGWFIAGAALGILAGLAIGVNLTKP